MGADELRELARDMLLELDERAHGRVVNSLINRAARSGSGWAPAALSGEDVSEIVAFAEAAQRVGQAEPSDVDQYLRRGSGAFLGKDYAAAFRIFGALLHPIGEGEIYLGQDEMVTEVLGVHPGECATQYLVSAYMTTAPEKRAQAVRAALGEVRSVGYFIDPLEEMERVAVEPLPGLDQFLPQWRALLRKGDRGERRSDWVTEEDRWLREVVRRLEGPDGLAKIARETRRADDLRAWCRCLVEARDWKAALAAFDESAELVNDKEHARGELLDGAALAAQELGRKDLPARLDRAWRSAPTMLRLRRWLGAAGSKAVVRKRAAGALEACPKQSHRQRAFLHVILGDFESAAKLLAAAPGLGWSDGEHPGHLIFPLFRRLLGGSLAPFSSNAEQLPLRGMDLEEFDLMATGRDEPRVAVPEVDRIIEQAGIGAVTDAKARGAVIEGMRKAAKHRVDGVTGKQRHRYYGHAASLVAICAAVDPSPATARWVARLRDEYRRYPALRAELEHHLGSP
jgi:hypothetical protein